MTSSAEVNGLFLVLKRQTLVLCTKLQQKYHGEKLMKCEPEASHRVTSSLMYLLIHSASLVMLIRGRYLNGVQFREQPLL